MRLFFLSRRLRRFRLFVRLRRLPRWRPSYLLRRWRLSNRFVR
jgi:hypothetical protein